MSEVDPELPARSIVESLPPHVLLVAAAKTRSAEEVQEAISLGVTAVGYNYVQEAETIRNALSQWEQTQAPHPVQWHLIGHLQRNKAKKAVALFDMIETIDSLRIAEAVNHHCADLGKVMPVLVEVNSGQESNKTGVPPERTESLIEQLAELPQIKVRGLMTMGPRFGDPEKARPYFVLTKNLFDRVAAKNDSRVEMRFLSMGMSNTYEQAIEEGANIVRIGTKLFGARPDACTSSTPPPGQD
jgi:pyridoxal phosphate enzyme (YggS family)